VDFASVYYADRHESVSLQHGDDYAEDSRAQFSCKLRISKSKVISN